MMNARFAGKCRCGSHFERGAVINYSRAARKVTGCPSCSDKRAEGHLADRFAMDYDDQCARDCGLDRFG